jgi:hypothetical protein
MERFLSEIVWKLGVSCGSCLLQLHNTPLTGILQELGQSAATFGTSSYNNFAAAREFVRPASDRELAESISRGGVKDCFRLW